MQLRSVEDLRGDSDAALEGGARRQMFPLLCARGQFHGTAALVVDHAAAFVLEFFDKSGPQPEALEGEIRPGRALLDLAARGEHAGAGPACFAAGRSCVKNRDAATGLRQPPRDRSSNNSG